MKMLTIRVAGPLDHQQWSPEALSLLIGVPTGDIRAYGRGHGTNLRTLPPEWMRAGRQRSKEAQAHTGRTGLESVLGYWAMKDHGARLEITYVDRVDPPGGCPASSGDASPSEADHDLITDRSAHPEELPRCTAECEGEEQPRPLHPDDRFLATCHEAGREVATVVPGWRGDGHGQRLDRPVYRV